MIHSEDSDRRESRVMTTSTNSVKIGGAGPGARMAPAVAVKPMSVDEKNRAIRARAVAEAKKRRRPLPPDLTRIYNHHREIAPPPR